MQLQDSQVKRFALDAGLVSRKDIDAAVCIAEDKNLSLSDALCVQGSLTADDTRRMSAYAFGVPYISLKQQTVEDDALTLIPEPITRMYNAVAFHKRNNGIEVALLDLATLENITPFLQSQGLRILPRLTDTVSMRDTIAHYQDILKHTYGDILRNESRILAENTPQTGKETHERATKRILDTLLQHALTQHASDIHIEPHDNECIIRYRIGDMLHDAMLLPRETGIPITERIKKLAHLTLTPSITPQESRFRMNTPHETVSFRVNITPTHWGEKTTLHIIRAHRNGFTLEGLGLHGTALEHVHNALTKKEGTILVAGTGTSGKTTTLYTMLDVCNTPKINITTVEEHVEAVLPRINQIPTRHDLGFSIAYGIRAALQQDPDVIMVDTIDNEETATLTLNAGNTGHLAIAGITAAGSTGAITRLRALGIDHHMLGTVKIIIAQHLIRRLGNEREKHYLTNTEINNLRKYAHTAKVLTALKDDGIIAKNATWASIPFHRIPANTEPEKAYNGNIIAVEVLPINQTIRNLIHTDASEADILENACKNGMLTFIEDALYKAAAGLTTLDEVWRLIHAYYTND